MSFVTPFRMALAVAAVGLLCGSALAQQQQQGQRGRFQGSFFPTVPGQEKLQLLVNEAVQKELELADDQKSDLKKIAEDVRPKIGELFNFQGLRELSEDERAKRRAETEKKAEVLGKDITKKVEAVLLPHQAERLQEIYVQVRGAEVLISDADIAKTLAITAEQKEKLTTVRDESRRAMFGGGQGGARPQAGQPGGFDPARMAAARKEREEKSLAILTAKQKDEYTKMKGEAFAEAANIRLGFGGQGGQGGRPQGGGQGGQPRTRPGTNNNNNNTNNN